MIKRGIFRSLVGLQRRSIILGKSEIAEESKENGLHMKIVDKIKVK